MSPDPWTTRTASGIRNVHTRLVPGPLADSSAALELLGTPADPVWPGDRWEPMVLDGGPVSGSRGGHGAVRYRVVSAEPGRSVAFAFTGRGLRGGHRFELEETEEGVLWRHVLEIEQPSWAVRHLVLPLHDALLEDLLDQVEAHLAGRPLTRTQLPGSVRLLAAVAGLVEPPTEDPVRRRRRARIGALTAAGLLGVAGVHAAWAAGITWPAADEAALAAAVLGSPSTTAMPEAPMTAAIAVLLALAAATVLARASSQIGLRTLGHLGCLGVSGVLAFRGVAGLLQSLLMPETVTEIYRVLDLAVYSPLCLLLAAGAWRARGSGQPGSRSPAHPPAPVRPPAGHGAGSR